MSCTIQLERVKVSFIKKGECMVYKGLSGNSGKGRELCVVAREVSPDGQRLGSAGLLESTFGQASRGCICVGIFLCIRCSFLFLFGKTIFFFLRLSLMASEAFGLVSGVRIIFSLFFYGGKKRSKIKRCPN